MAYRPTTIPGLFSPQKAKFSTHLFFLLTRFRLNAIFVCSFVVCLTKTKFLENWHIILCRLIKKKKKCISNLLWVFCMFVFPILYLCSLHSVYIPAVGSCGRRN